MYFHHLCTLTLFVQPSTTGPTIDLQDLFIHTRWNFLITTLLELLPTLPLYCRYDSMKIYHHNKVVLIVFNLKNIISLHVCITLCMEIFFELSQQFVELIELSTEEQNVDFGLHIEMFFHNQCHCYCLLECEDELEMDQRVAILLETIEDLLPKLTVTLLLELNKINCSNMLRFSSNIVYRSMKVQWNQKAQPSMFLLPLQGISLHPTMLSLTVAILPETIEEPLPKLIVTLLLEFIQLTRIQIWMRIRIRIWQIFEKPGSGYGQDTPSTKKYNNIF